MYKIFLIFLIMFSLSIVQAEESTDADDISTSGIVRLSTTGGLNGTNTQIGTGFFVDPHTLVTTFSAITDIRGFSEITDIRDFQGKVADSLFMVNLETDEHVPVHSIQAISLVNDLVVLHIKDYKSPVYYELFNGSSNSLPSSQVYIFDNEKQSFPKVEGIVSHLYPFERSFEKTV